MEVGIGGREVSVGARLDDGARMLFSEFFETSFSFVGISSESLFYS